MFFQKQLQCHQTWVPNLFHTYHVYTKRENSLQHLISSESKNPFRGYALPTQPQNAVDLKCGLWNKIFHYIQK
ncbi:hypothetical protein RchiOBHm_Chr2g0115251 [Rosa chinensis]|uniref:Uncharacterized protein n=1 Tax=Rosa chinensis TaxID=74649 RepID=A0A2P6RQZ2_ROSCH|nr:hypothetical protein RchiOBHm_Chr2g0115251 [Rosa chinensis]